MLKKCQQHCNDRAATHTCRPNNSSSCIPVLTSVLKNIHIATITINATLAKEYLQRIMGNKRVTVVTIRGRERDSNAIANSYLVTS